MLRAYLSQRRGKRVSDEDEEAYCLGFRDACEAMRSDEVYYEVANAKQSLSTVIHEAANYVERYEAS